MAFRSIKPDLGLEESLHPQTQEGWLELENADLRFPRLFAKRAGDRSLGNQVAPSGTLPASMHACWHRGSERLVVGGEGNLYGFDGCTDKWRSRGRWTPGRLRERILLSQAFGLGIVDAQTLGGCTLLVGIGTAVTGNSDVWYAVIDETDAVIVPPTVLFAFTGAGQGVRVCKADSFILVAYHNGTTLQASRWLPSAPTTFSFTNTASPLVAPVAMYDVRRRPGTDLVTIAWVNTVNKIDFEDRDSGNAVAGGGSHIAAAAVATVIPSGLSVSPQSSAPSGSVRLAWFSAANVVTALNGGAELTIAFANTAMKISVADKWLVVSLTDGTDQRTEFFVITGVITRVRTLPFTDLYSHTWSQGGQYLVTVAYDENIGVIARTRHTYSRYMVLDVEDGEVVARGFVQEAHTRDFFSIFKPPSTIDQDGSTARIACVALSPKTVSATGTTVTEYYFAAALMEIDTTTRPQSPAIIDSVAHAAHAGYVRAYDGRSVYEHDWHLPPECANPAGAVTGGALLTATSTYTIALCWEWMDNTGRVSRSAPTIRSVTLVGAENSVTVSVKPLHFTERTGVRLIGWQSEANSSKSLFRALDVANNTAVARMTLTFIASDAQAKQNEKLDQVTGGVRAHDSTPATDFCAKAGGRLWTRDPRRGGLVRFSLPRREGFALSWSPLQGVELADEKDALAIAEQDGQIVVFTSSTAHITVGDGPTATGGGSEFASPQSIPIEIGPVSQESVAAVCGEGIAYGSAQGPRMFSRGRASADVGVAVARAYRLDGQRVVAAGYVPAANEVIWGDDGATAARHTKRLNLTTGRWTNDTGRQVRDLSVSKDGELMMMLTTPRVVVEDPTRTVDSDGANYDLVMRTPWLRLVEFLLPSMSHVWFGFFGRYIDAHIVRQQLFYDHAEGTPSYDQTITPSGGATYQYAQNVSRLCAAVSLRLRVTGSGRCAEIVSIDTQLEPNGTGPLLLPAAASP